MVDGLIDCYYKGSFTHVLFITYSCFVHNMHMKARGKQLSVAAAQSMLALAQQEAAATADGAASVGNGLGDLSLSNFTNLTESMTMDEIKDAQK